MAVSLRYTAPTPLHRGLEVRCPHCRQWHVIEQPYADDSTAAQSHLYVTCRCDRYFVGQVGHEGRWPVRERAGDGKGEW
jgi:hypothetical protein